MAVLSLIIRPVLKWTVSQAKLFLFPTWLTEMPTPWTPSKSTNPFKRVATLYLNRKPTLGTSTFLYDMKQFFFTSPFHTSMGIFLSEIPVFTLLRTRIPETISHIRRMWQILDLFVTMTPTSSTWMPRKTEIVRRFYLTSCTNSPTWTIFPYALPWTKTTLESPYVCKIWMSIFPISSSTTTPL